VDCSAHLARGDVDPGRGIEGLGAENPAFLHHNGAGVLGFATHAYSVPGVSAYTWWASFLQSFVAPNESWIALLVAVGELAIGIALAFGILTPLAALASLALPFTYSMSGTASVTAFYALFAVVILAAWHTSGWIGVDGMIHRYLQHRRDHRTRRPCGRRSRSNPSLALLSPFTVLGGTMAVDTTCRGTVVVPRHRR
jgi:uncharacterized membrane protein YphA (DoxX/SURF4 family)